MADRASFTLAYGVQTAFGTPLATGLKPLRVSEWDPGINFGTVDDDSNLPNTRLGAEGRPGTVTLQPTIRVNFGTDEYDVWLQSLFQGAWATNVLTQGNTRQWMTVEDRQADAASYIVCQDVIPNTGRITLGPNALVPFQFGCIATQFAVSGTATTTPVAAGSDKSFDTWSGSLLYGGSAFAMSRFEMTMDNRGEGRMSLFNRYADRIVFAPDRVTGAFDCQYTGPTRITDTLNNTPNAISIVMLGHAANGTAKQHTWLIPVTKNVGWAAPLRTDPERIQTINFQAVLNAGTKVQVTRA
jgi:hypothetical protein